jgi:SAM-dependent methyltransferase
MTPEELHNIYRAETDFWWYEGMRAVTWGLLDELLPRGLSKGLDAGCGTGMNALTFESRYGVPMYGVDLARLGVEYCRKRGVARTAVASVLSLPFPDQEFDLVSSIDVFPVLPPGGDEQALREFRRVLKPSGWLFLRAAAFRSLRSRHSQYVSEGHRYRAGELLRKLESNAFTVVRWTYANSILSPVAWVKFRIWENLTRQAPQSGVAQSLPSWLNGLLLTALQQEAALIRAGMRLPFGQSLMIVARKP